MKPQKGNFVSSNLNVKRNGNIFFFQNKINHPLHRRSDK